MRIQAQRDTFAYRMAGYYDVTMKLQDGTTATGEADIGSQARQIGESMAAQYGYTLGDPQGGPDSVGRSPVDYPVYDQDGNWVGKVLVEHGADLEEQGYGQPYVNPLKAAGIQDDTYDDQWKHDVEDAAHHGDPPGFTMRDHIGDEPKSGYMYSIEGHGDERPPEEATGDFFSDYAHDHQEQLRPPGRYMGGWPETPEEFDTDVSEHTEDPWLATERSYENNQKALHDFNNNDDVLTRNAPGKLFPEQPGLGFWMGGRDDRGTARS